MQGACILVTTAESTSSIITCYHVFGVSKGKHTAAADDHSYHYQGKALAKRDGVLLRHQCSRVEGDRSKYLKSRDAAGLLSIHVETLICPPTPRYSLRILPFAPHNLMNPRWSTSWEMGPCTSSPVMLSIENVHFVIDEEEMSTS